MLDLGSRHTPYPPLESARPSLPSVQPGRLRLAGRVAQPPDTPMAKKTTAAAGSRAPAPAVRRLSPALRFNRGSRCGNEPLATFSPVGDPRPMAVLPYRGSGLWRAIRWPQLQNLSCVGRRACRSVAGGVLCAVCSQPTAMHRARPDVGTGFPAFVFGLFVVQVCHVSCAGP